ncbi:Bdr family repetitive protein [Borreliella valaisiana]|uniref:Uncharacterized protein n=1 Tax=Borreliella valaisiana VS116 TaxID=445987 RepID=C0R9B0_BORVA|nr:Bdr family repetitive protein [Borreliella valaisiana]ACN52990.1 hypothetical protein BVAVS116_H0053 [Borreliella valaisiana VS116]
MSNLAYKAYNIESIKNEFLKIGLNKEEIDFVFIHNNNYNFEFLKERLIDVERNLRKDLNMGNRLIHFMTLTAAILGPILNALFMRYLQFIK